jgi:integrase
LLRWNQVDLEDGIITAGKSKPRGGDGRIVPLSQTALNALHEWKSNFPRSFPSDAVFPRELYGLIGEKGKKPNESKVARYKTFPNTPVTTFATAWRTAKKKADEALRNARNLTVEQWRVSGDNNHIQDLSPLAASRQISVEIFALDYRINRRRPS